MVVVVCVLCSITAVVETVGSSTSTRTSLPITCFESHSSVGESTITVPAELKLTGIVWLSARPASLRTAVHEDHGTIRVTTLPSSLMTILTSPADLGAREAGGGR